MTKRKAQIFIDECGLLEDITRTKDFLSEVFEHCKKVKHDQKANLLMSALNQIVKVPGYRAFELADINIQINSFIQHLKRSPLPIEVILECWVDINSNFMNHTLNYVLSLERDRFQSLKKKIPLNEGHDEVKTIWNDLIKKHSLESSHKFLLCLYYLFLFDEDLIKNNEFNDNNDNINNPSTVRDLDVDKTDDESCLSDFWKNLVAQIEIIPTASSEWNLLPVFIKQLNELLEKKKAERAAEDLRQKTEELLINTKELINKYPDDVILSELRSWSLKKLPDNELEAFSNQLSTFRQQVQHCFDLYKDLQTNFFNVEKITTFQSTVEEINKQLKAFSISFPKLCDPTESNQADQINYKQFKDDATINHEERITQEKLVKNNQIELNSCPNQASFEHKNECILQTVASDDEIKDLRYKVTVKPSAEMVIAKDVHETSIASQESNLAINVTSAGNENCDVVKPVRDTQIISPYIPVEKKVSDEKTGQIAKIIHDEAEKANFGFLSLLYDLIIADDLPGAIWLSKSLEQSGTGSAIASWLIEAILGSRLLNWDDDMLSLELLDISTKNTPNNKDIDKVFGLAAALKPTLLSPSSGMISWLSEPDSLNEIHAVVTTILQFAHNRIPLKQQDLIGIQDKETRKRNFYEISREAQIFITEMPKRTLERKSTTKVLGSFTSSDGPIRELLSYVVNDVRKEKQSVLKLLESWENEDFVAAQIEKGLCKYLRNSRQIGAGPREQIHQHVREACSIAKKWVNEVDREDLIEKHGNWIFEQVKRLKDHLESSLPKVFNALEDISNEFQPIERRAAAIVLGRSLIQLADFLKIDVCASQRNNYLSYLENWIVGNGETIQSTLRDRLIWLPELRTQKDYLSKEMELTDLPKALKKSFEDNRTLTHSVKMWIESKDFRFVEKAIAHLEDDNTSNELRRDYRENLQGSRLALKEYIDSARETIEQAWVDSVLLDDEHSEMLGKIEQFQPDKEMNIDFANTVIKNEILDKLANARQARLAHYKRVWADLENKISMITDKKEVLEPIGSAVRAAIQDGEIRVLGESISHLLEVIEMGKEIDETLFQRREKPTRGVLVDFISKLPEIENFLLQNKKLEGVMNAIKTKQTILSIHYSQLIADRLDSAYEGVKAFYELGKSQSDQNLSAKSVRKILSFLGYRPFNGNTIHAEIKSKTTDMLYLRASVTAANLARPISEFGSLIEGALNVLVLWERPIAETITSHIQRLNLDRQGVVVLYPGRLNQTQRREILKLCRSQNITIAVLDETLLVYLTKERGERLSPFLKCALPFTALNPYKPFVQGDVPFEMFYGRHRMADSLQQYSNCLVYGGRQLGKSALLRHVQRTFHNPSLERYALYADIKNIGAANSRDANRYQNEIWERIRDELKNHGLLKPTIHTYKPDILKKHIQEFISEKKDRRILFLFDEADNFLDADSESKAFPVLQDLKELMSNTNRRFKVVFAGLQNVQRFQGIPNQPLAQFGIPLKVGPLEPVDAAQLVWEPMEFLGIEIDDATALRILSYTNYHAGLIQFFCQKLVDRIFKKEPQYGPTKIQREDIEAVYKEQAVRDEIRQRLNLTLQLDTRYQAITWALIEEQKSDRDGYSRSFAPKDVLDLVRNYWIKGFAHTEVDDMSSKLDEMCALGILVRNSDGCFRLRSPNIVALMGPNIDVRLSELSNKEPEEKFRPDSHHTLLDRECRKYSPLTYSQERDLTIRGSGVSMVFASLALGLSNLADAFLMLIPQGYIEEGIGVIQDIPDNIRIPAMLSDFVTATLKKHSNAEQIIFLFRPKGGAVFLEKIVSEALSICARQQNRTSNRMIKILFILDSETTENWMLLAPEKRDDLETKCDAVLSPKLWNVEGIRHRLDQEDKLSAPEVCRAIMDATGGWTYLLDDLFNFYDQESNLSEAAREFKRKLFEKGSEHYGSFLKAVSLCGLPGTIEVFNVFNAMGSVDECDLPDLYQLIETENAKRPTQEDVMRVIEYFRRFRILQISGTKVQLDGMVKKMHGI